MHVQSKPAVEFASRSILLQARLDSAGGPENRAAAVYCATRVDAVSKYALDVETTGTRNMKTAEIANGRVLNFTTSSLAKLWHRHTLTETWLRLVGAAS